MKKGEPKPKNLAIPADLHAALKEMAKRQGMKLTALAEFKLRELLEPQQLELVEGGK